MKAGTFGIIILGFLNIAIVIGGLYAWRVHWRYDTILAIIAILLALTTFFGFLAVSQSLGKGLASNIGSMRTAIASAILVLYFFILSISLFLTRSTPVSDFSESLVNHFTTIIGIIIPFYFGASAYVEVRTRTREKEIEDKGYISD